MSSHCSPTAQGASSCPPGTVRVVKTAATVALMLIRLCAVVLIALGVLFWTGNALPLVPLHILVGLVAVGMGEVLAARIRRAEPEAARA